MSIITDKYFFNGSANITINDTTTHSQLDTINNILSNGVVISQSISSNLKADVNVINSVNVSDTTVSNELVTLNNKLDTILTNLNEINISISKGIALQTATVISPNNTAVYPIVGPVKVYGFYMAQRNETSSQTCFFYDSTSGVTNETIPKQAVYMPDNREQEVVYPGNGYIEFLNGVAVRVIADLNYTSTATPSRLTMCVIFYTPI